MFSVINQIVIVCLRVATDMFPVVDEIITISLFSAVAFILLLTTVMCSIKRKRPHLDDKAGYMALGRMPARTGTST